MDKNHNLLAVRNPRRPGLNQLGIVTSAHRYMDGVD